MRSCKLMCVSVVVTASVMQRTAAGPTTPPTFSHVAYSDEHFRHHLDIYMPSETCGPTPAVIYVHGGGWVVGDKADVAPFVDTLLARGLAVVAINYRFSYQAIFPAQIHDCKGAIRFLRANAAKYGLDPDHFAIFGESAGAYLAALVGTSSGVADLEGTIGGNGAFPSAVQAAAPCGGPYNLIQAVQDPPHNQDVAHLFGYANWWEMDFGDPKLVALMTAANPGTHADAADPPFRIVHGELDDIVPVAQAQGLHAALTDSGAASTLVILAGVGHGIPDVQFEPIFDFFATQLQTPLIGDVTCDGRVDIEDLLLVIAAWGPCKGGSPCPDVTGDGEVDIDDLLTVISNWTG